MGRSRPKKLGPCWKSPFQVVSVDSIRQTVTLGDPTDLLVMKPDVHVSQLRKYRMGLTGATDLLDLRAMDTAEDVIVRFIDHDMHYPQGKGSKNSRKLLPRSEWRFEAEFSDGSTNGCYGQRRTRWLRSTSMQPSVSSSFPQGKVFFRMIFFPFMSQSLRQRDSGTLMTQF